MLIQRIRELKKTFPVVVCSAFKHLQDDYVIGTSGIAAYITKPVNLEDFKKKIREILEPK